MNLLPRPRGSMRLFQTKVKVEDLSRSGFCVTAGNKVLGFFSTLWARCEADNVHCGRIFH